MAIIETQIGKQGVTINFIETLKNHFKKNKVVRISVLKSARPEGAEGKQKVKEYSEKLLSNLGENYSSKIIGFTIILKKYGKPVSR